MLKRILRALGRILLGLVVILLIVLFIVPYLIPLPPIFEHSAKSLARPEMQFITVDGIQTVIEVTGPANGQAVVLVHGFGGSTYSWRYTLRVLGEAGYRTVALDLKGFGLSDKKFDMDYSHAAQADFVAHTMDALGIARATLVGHSMGGNVIAHFALKYPDRVEKLVFVDAAISETNAGFRLGGGAIPLVTVGDVVNVPPLQRWGQILLRNFYTPAQLANILRSAYYNPDAMTDEALTAYSLSTQMKEWDLALLAVMRDMNKNALPRPVSDIRAPTLIIWGENDTWIPLGRGEALRAKISRAEWYVLPRAGHLSLEEQPAMFNRRVIEFLRATSR